MRVRESLKGKSQCNELIEYHLCKMLKRTPSELFNEPAIDLERLFHVDDVLFEIKTNELKKDLKKANKNPFGIIVILLSNILESLENG